ncbi:hypothetical protein ACJMK2_035665, partial [Sinanodonta woodiana]
ATDQEGDPFTYSLTNLTAYSNEFVINNITGLITVNTITAANVLYTRRLDRETRPSFQLLITATETSTLR